MSEKCGAVSSSATWDVKDLMHTPSHFVSTLEHFSNGYRLWGACPCKVETKLNLRWRAPRGPLVG
eukprot:6212727-Amphidinium_carterae.1